MSHDSTNGAWIEMDAFQDHVKAHLANYKTNVLGVHENGIWPRNGKRYAHILPKSSYDLNILPSIRKEFWSWFDLWNQTQQQIKLHQFFHHLNSSQALCFNLFFPFLATGFNPLLRALNFDGQVNAGASFEFVPKIDEGTNFDFMLPLQSESQSYRIYFEIKYTENEFGRAEDDGEHRRKFESIYKPQTTERFAAEYCSCSKFLAHYQILRNLWHLDLTKDDAAVFLIPRANTSLRRQEKTIQTCLLPQLRSRAKIIYIEDLLLSLETSKEVSDIYKSGTLAEFKVKYFPGMQTRQA